VTRPARVTRRAVRHLLITVLVLSLSGCAMGLESIPLPARGSVGNDSYSLDAVFSNALNLPAKARVKYNGADIGEVTDIRARDFTAVVTMRIRSDVPVYLGSTAELRSATPLGDVFVAIKPPLTETADPVRLADGDTIGRSSTASGATVEEVLSSASLLVNGGTLRRLVTVLNGTGVAVGDKGDKIAAFLRNLNSVLTRLNSRSEELTETLRATDDLATTLASRQRTLDELIAVAGPATSTVGENVDQVTALTDTVAGITRQLSRFPSIQGTDTRSVVADLNELSRAFNEIAVAPDVSMYTSNRMIPLYMKLTHSTATPTLTDVRQLALGSLPDLNYPGDPARHGPDGTDWHLMVGGLRYQWNLLLDQIYGPNR
jgi:virulence factor Mce-like protein